MSKPTDAKIAAAEQARAEARTYDRRGSAEVAPQPRDMAGVPVDGRLATALERIAQTLHGGLRPLEQPKTADEQAETELLRGRRRRLDGDGARVRRGFPLPANADVAIDVARLRNQRRAPGE